MRVSSFGRRIIARAFGASVAIAAMTAASSAGETSTDLDASCRVPFEVLKDPKTGESFPVSAALNDNAQLPENLRGRYVVADLSSTDENGFCRGVREHFSPVANLSEFPRLRAIAEARKVDITALASVPVEELRASEPTPQMQPGSMWNWKTSRTTCSRFSATRRSPS